MGLSLSLRYENTISTGRAGFITSFRSSTPSKCSRDAVSGVSATPMPRRYMAMGMTMIAVGSDQGLFRASTQALRDKFMV